MRKQEAPDPRGPGTSPGESRSEEGRTADRGEAPRVLIAGGGTGGHVIPALCVADRLGALGAVVEFVGAESGIESELVSQAGYRLHSLPLAGFSGSVGDRLRAGTLFLRALGRCREIVRDFDPRAVLGVGGYASAPAVAAANLLRVPTFLHEQNSVPGRVNRLASRFTEEMFVTFPEAGERLRDAVWVGMPTRGEFFDLSREEALRRRGLEPPVVLIFGGSGGALNLNLAAAGAFREETPYTVVQVAGRRDYPRLSTENPRHQILEYDPEIWELVAAAEVVVIRSGAGSLFDTAAAGRASLLVPFPHATGDHQTRNARYFTDKDAAELLPDAEVTAATLRARVEALLEDGPRRAALAARMRELSTPEAAGEVARRLLQATGNDKE